MAVDVQDADADSILNFFRHLIAMRFDSAALRVGDLAFLDAPRNVLAFMRRADGESVVCVFNLGDQAVDWNAYPGTVLASVGIAATTPDDLLPPWSGYITELADG
jgi:alpha-glucosidase